MVQKYRKLLGLLLTCLLIFTQQVGFAHALSHLANPSAPRPARGDTHHPAEKACTECMLFAQLGAALSSTVAEVPVARAPALSFVESSRTFSPEFSSAYHSRAPPLSIG